jgi:hypothetical protein
MHQHYSSTQEGNMLAVFKFFAEGYPSYKLAKFRTEWSELTDADKTQLKQGVADGSFTY